MILWLPAGVVFVTGVGYWSLLSSLRELNNRYHFAADFHRDLITYLESHGRDVQRYASLIQRSVRMQEQLGPLGVQAYKPPFANYYLTNYSIVLNLLPELHRAFEDETLASGTAIRGQANLVQ
jgi:hypothetical protein